MAGNPVFRIESENLVAGREYIEVTIIISNHITTVTAAGTMDGYFFVRFIISDTAEIRDHWFFSGAETDTGFLSMVKRVFSCPKIDKLLIKTRKSVKIKGLIVVIIALILKRKNNNFM